MDTKSEIEQLGLLQGGYELVRTEITIIGGRRSGQLSWGVSMSEFFTHEQLVIEALGSMPIHSAGTRFPRELRRAVSMHLELTEPF